VHQKLGKETKEEMLVETHGETEIGPIMSEFESLQSIHLEVHLTIEVLLVEDLHRDLALATVGSAIMFAVEVEVVFDGAAGILGLFVLAGRDGRSHGPEGHQDGDGGEDGEEDGGVETTTHLAGEVPRNQEEQREEKGVGEAITASGIRRDGGIFNGGILRANENKRSVCIHATCFEAQLHQLRGRWDKEEPERMLNPMELLNWSTYRCRAHTAVLVGSRTGGSRSLDELKVLSGLRMDLRLSHDELRGVKRGRGRRKGGEGGKG
jgi:hypothetical protein